MITRRVLLSAAVLALVVALMLAVSGGVVVTAYGLRLSARAPRAALLVAITCAVAWAWASRSGRVALVDLAWVGTAIEARAVWMAAALTLVSGGLAFTLGGGSPSGADASGYLSQAALWASGDTRLADPLIALPHWPLAPDATAPLGWRPALAAGLQVPTYAPGLPWLMAPLWWLGGDAAARLVIVGSALAMTGATAACAWRLAGAQAAPIAAALIAASPTAIYHALVPMSDVPVTTAWLVGWWALVSGWPACAGLAVALAVVIRPNLAPLAAVPLVTLVAIVPPSRRWQTAVAFSASVAVAGLLIALVQWHWYGSPLRSGYGAPDELFATANIMPNAWLYLTWLWQAERTLVVTLVAVTAAVTARHVIAKGRRPETHHGGFAAGTGAAGRRSTLSVWIGLAVFAAGVVAAYLVYAVFEHWTYLRFLLPALAVVAVATGGLFARATCDRPAAMRGWLVALGTLAILAAGWSHTRALDVFTVTPLTARAAAAGAALRAVLPANAVLLAGEQSGAMRHLTGRPVVRWEALTPETLTRTLAALHAGGYQAWWVLDQWEEAPVRSRLGAVPQALLDWPPSVEGGPLMRTRAWRIPD